MSENEQKEFRLRSGITILEYMREFSSTEKVIFGVLAILAMVSAVAMMVKVSDSFMTAVPAYGGELREGMIGLPRTINPVLAVTDADKDLSSVVYSGLLKYEDGALAPDIAKSYTISTDGLTYNFKLRSDIYFQDGAELTADDVEFTVQKIQDSNLKSPRRADWANVTVKKISATEIQFLLKQAYSPFLANTTVGILPKHIWGGVNDDQFIFSQYNVNPIGSGPFKVAAVARDSGGIPTEYRLETWKKYYGNKPYISSLRAKFFADMDKALAALDTGAIDSLPTVSPGVAVRLASDSAQAYKVMPTPLPRVFGIFFNQNQATILADKVVRQALNMSVDRDLIVKTVLNGYGSVINGPLPPGFTGATASDNAKTSAVNATDIANAQALLEKNGWKKSANGVYGKKTAKSATTTISFDIYTADTPDLKQTAELVKNSWTKLGARVNIKVSEAGDLYQNVIKTRKYDALLFGEQVGKDRDLYAFWHSSQRNSPGLNVALYTNSKVDAVLSDIRGTNDDSRRSDDYIALDRLITDDLPAIFLYSPDFIYVVPKNLKGIILDSVATPSDRWNSIANWYLNTEKVWRFFTNNN